VPLTSAIRRKQRTFRVEHFAERVEGVAIKENQASGHTAQVSENQAVVSFERSHTGAQVSLEANDARVRAFIRVGTCAATFRFGQGALTGGICGNRSDPRLRHQRTHMS